MIDSHEIKTLILSLLIIKKKKEAAKTILYIEDDILDIFVKIQIYIDH